MLRVLVVLAACLVGIGCSNPSAYVDDKEMSSQLVVNGLPYEAVEAVCVNDSFYIDYYDGRLKVKTVEMFPLALGACKVGVEFQFGESRFTTGEMLITEIKDGYISGGISFTIDDRYGVSEGSCTFNYVKISE